MKILIYFLDDKAIVCTVTTIRISMKLQTLLVVYHSPEISLLLFRLRGGVPSIFTIFG
jgi:hypothetical protein